MFIKWLFTYLKQTSTDSIKKKLKMSPAKYRLLCLSLYSLHSYCEALVFHGYAFHVITSNLFGLLWICKWINEIADYRINITRPLISFLVVREHTLANSMEIISMCFGQLYLWIGICLIQISCLMLRQANMSYRCIYRSGHEDVAVLLPGFAIIW